MKKLLMIAALVTVSPSAFAFSDFNFPTNYPTNSQWAIGMVEMACHINLDQNQVVGQIANVDGGVVYTIKNKNGKVVAAAAANSTFILANKKCLTK